VEPNGAAKDSSMSGNTPNPGELADIHGLASDPTRVRVTQTVEYDLLAHHLTKEDVCDEIIA